MKILITGANGYIGSRVCSFAKECGQEVIACDVSCSHLTSDIKFIECNIFENLKIN